jgi:uncharacterized DUF497 family protein
VDIEWDPKKAQANEREHGVAFSEAATVLTDDHALTREDQDAEAEQRFVSLGMSATGALLVVVVHASRTRHLPPHLGMEGEQATKETL